MVEEVDRKRVCSFLRMLQVDFEFVIANEECSNENVDADLNRTFERPNEFVKPVVKQVPSSSSAQNVTNPVTEEMQTTEATEEPVMLDEDWTVTTVSDQRVAEIDHSWERLPNRNRNKYTCNHCGETCLELRKAERHFTNMHLNLKSIVELLANVDQKRKKCYQEFTDLVETLQQSGNKILVRHELELTMDKLSNLKTELKEKIVKKIPPQHTQKKKLLERNIHVIESEVEEYIRNNLD